MSFSDVLFSFKGRINRSQFWKYNLGLIIVLIAMGALALLMGIVQTESQLDTFTIWISLIFLWPSLAIAVKRCHDRDKSGAWVLLSCIPVVGIVWWVVALGFMPGTPEKNLYDLL